MTLASVADHNDVRWHAPQRPPGHPGHRAPGRLRPGERTRAGRNARTELRTALQQLESQAQAARKAAGKPASRRAAAEQAGLGGQRISDWLNEDPAKAPAPQDWERVWALIRTWWAWTGRAGSSSR
jgi:hypothetical protein